MRTDVKIGAAFAFLCVVAVSVYFGYRTNEEPSVNMNDNLAIAKPGDGASKLASAEADNVRPAKPSPSSRATRPSATRSPVPSDSRVAMGSRQGSTPNNIPRRVDRPESAPTTTSPATGSVPTGSAPAGSPAPGDATQAAGGLDHPATPSDGGRISPEGVAGADHGGPMTPASGSGDRSTTMGDETRGGPTTPGEGGRTHPATTVLPQPAEAPASLASRRPTTPIVTNPAARPRTTTLPPVRPVSEADAAVDIHTVQSGDTFASLADVYYGSQRYMQFLIDANPQIQRPDQLKIGVEIRIPPKPEDQPVVTADAQTPQRPAATPAKPVGSGRTYTVRDGDSFWGIAQRELGDGNRWQELFELNKDVVKGVPRNLKPGQVLTLPGTGS